MPAWRKPAAKSLSVNKSRVRTPVPGGFDPNAPSTLSAGLGVGPTTPFAVLRVSNRIGVKRITRFINGQALSRARSRPRRDTKPRRRQGRYLVRPFRDSGQMDPLSLLIFSAPKGML